MLKRIVLGPQRPVVNIGDALKKSGIPQGEIAVISAGWQEAEGDIDDVREAAGRSLVDLRLYHRAEQLFANDDRLRTAYRARQDKLIELQRLYRLRLRQLMIAARNMLRAEGDEVMIAAERRHAVSQLRALDRHHLQRVCTINETFDSDYNSSSYAPLAEQAAEIAVVLENCGSLIITGGNVVILMNRLRLFGMHRHLGEKHLIAWSAGAMVLGDRIVLYHDRTPQGRRDPELFGPGVGLLPGYVFMPDAKRRLREKDVVRVGLSNLRFAPDVLVALDSGSMLQFEDRNLVAAEDAKRLTREGRLSKVRAR